MKYASLIQFHEATFIMPPSSALKTSQSILWNDHQSVVIRMYCPLPHPQQALHLRMHWKKTRSRYLLSRSLGSRSVHVYRDKPTTVALTFILYLLSSISRALRMKVAWALAEGLIAEAKRVLSTDKTLLICASLDTLYSLLRPTVCQVQVISKMSSMILLRT